ncbi:HlyD family secretion protein [Fibrella aquatilis]|uniref:HlyD family efflux transporter periplasmic adaptor subunit n=1 Tax=Fibrella aquatilis TaxID=2817059 RepID=A0A939G8J7_9BACT|nr:HlyD family efflux transporter periplasmic adaptor subunit [Fibrella aquatilis]MBO0932609.1 HlyD family efflux transporter periplasmic adaptor subunit [Fibrella aquatilis]
MNTTPTFQELRAEEVQELLTRPPTWLLRWGTLVVLAVLLVVLAGAWFIHYPDLVHASFRLTSTNAPKAVLTRTEGKIVRLLVRDGRSVKQGELLAFLESTAHHPDVLRLSVQLAQAWQTARRSNIEGIERLNLSRYRQLGELQTAYQSFEQAHIQLRAYLANGFSSRKKAMLQQEITDLQALATNLRQQQQLQARDQTLAEDDYAIQQQLAEQKVIAQLDLKREESKTIARKLPYQQTASSLISNLTAQRAKEKEILDLDRQVAEERDKFLQALNTLQSAVDAWKLKYVLTAPVGGKLIFVGVVQENQAIALNQELFYVAPPNTSYVGELHIPQHNAGKVEEGQTVLIRFAGYPYQEYGAVRGRIKAISSIPYRDSVFLARVILPNGLRTTYHKTLTQKTGMTATADIITNDTRLLEKLFYQLRKMQGGR